MEIDRQMKEHFLQTVTRNEEGCYEISLLWAEDKPSLPDSLCLATERFINVMQKLLAIKSFENILKYL